RGAMMLLGVYLHAMVAYSDRGSWPWKDGTTTGIFDISLGLIHLFRMPMFYVMAGFFSALLPERPGGAGFVPHPPGRCRLALVPFVAGWAVLFPLVKALALTGESLGEVALMPSRFAAFFSSGAVWDRLDPMHLWFLEYLLIFYAAALAAASVARCLPRTALAR